MEGVCNIIVPEEFELHCGRVGGAMTLAVGGTSMLVLRGEGTQILHSWRT